MSDMTDIVESLHYWALPPAGETREPENAALLKWAAAEIEQLRSYVGEIERWKEEGERIIGPAAEWGPGGNVMVRSSVMFKLGAWWADRPWRREAIPFCASCGKQKERCDGC